LRPAITSKIIAQDMSVPENPIRLVDERRRAAWPEQQRSNGARRCGLW
jgi:hypothetical protein